MYDRRSVSLLLLRTDNLLMSLGARQSFLPSDPPQRTLILVSLNEKKQTIQIKIKNEKLNGESLKYVYIDQYVENSK